MIAAAELDDTALEGYAAVFLCDALLSDRAVLRLDRRLQGGGTVVFFGGDRSSIENLARIEFLPVKPTRVRELQAGGSATICRSSWPVRGGPARCCS